MLRKIHFYGALKKFSKKPITIDVADVADLFSALKSAFGPEFKKYLSENPRMSILLSKPARKQLTPVYSEFIRAPFNDKLRHIHIIPETEGAGIEIAVLFGMTAGAASTIIVGAIINVAISLAISAVANMLAPKPSNSQGQERPDERPSFLYNGAENVMEQGYQVPVVYGTHMTGSVVVSAGISVEQIPYVPARVEQPVADQPGAAPYEPWQWDGGNFA